jgi:hypothetical protein
MCIKWEVADETPNDTRNASVPSWFKRPWAIISGIAVTVGVFFLNINSVLTNARTFPTELSKTANEITSWYYEDASWKGYWTSKPEFYVDIEDMNLSSIPFAISIHAENGELSGQISHKSICNSLAWDFALFEGSIDRFGDSAEITVYDIIGGRKVYFENLKLSLDGSIMTVESLEGSVNKLPKVRIALDPNVKDWPEEFCEGKQAALIDLARRFAKERANNKQLK